MKKYLIIVLILSFGLVSCTDNSTVKTVEASSTKYIQISDGGDIETKTIILDGNEYYAIRTTHGYWTLCPKLPPKETK